MIKIKFREISRYHYSHQNSPCTSRLKNPIIHHHFRNISYHLAQPRETFQSPVREKNPCQNTHNKKKEKQNTQNAHLFLKRARRIHPYPRFSLLKRAAWRAHHPSLDDWSPLSRHRRVLLWSTNAVNLRLPYGVHIRVHAPCSLTR